MKKRILVGSFEIESNSLTTVVTRREDFDITVGYDGTNRVEIFDYLQQQGCEVIKTLFASAVPGGRVVRSEFESILADLLAQFPQNGTYDGVFLFLHGAMDVEEIGSGDCAIAKAVREKIGADIPLAIAFDLHADIDPLIANYANIITGYRTAPHTDIKRTQQQACELLLKCIDMSYLPQPLVVKVPIIADGDSMTTDVYPGTELIAKLCDLEHRHDIMCLNIFLGNPWVDSLCAGGAVVAIPNVGKEDEAAICALELAQSFWDVRGKFEFRGKHLGVEDSIAWATSQTNGPVFLSDTGDNISGGGSGDNALLLKEFLKIGVSDSLFVGIADADVVAMCKGLNEGDWFDCTIGKTQDPNSIQVSVRAQFLRRGIVCRWPGDGKVLSVLIRVDGIDILITESRTCIVSKNTFYEFGLNFEDYKIIVMKMGYLWPDFYDVAKDFMMVFTKGSTCEVVEECEFHVLPRPIYPLDKDMDWTPKIAPLSV